MKHRYGIEALSRGLKVLELFSPKRPTLRLNEIVEMSGLHKTTAFRILKTLEAEGYLELEPSDGSYRPGLKALSLGFTALSGLDLREIARPHLSQLAQDTDLTTSLSVLNQLEIIYLERIRNRRIVNVMLGPGARVPAHCTSMGKVLLAGLPAQELRERLSQASLEACTARTVVDLELLEEELRTIRRQGYAVNDGELAMGLRAVAAPIVDARRTTRAAINVAGARENISDQRLTKELPARVMAVAATISRYFPSEDGGSFPS